MILPQLSHLASICAKSGITQAILSPGSRCAPISLALIRHPLVHCRTIPDERSAAFIALGMAQQLNKPVILVCTSGSAALNYGPALAEAFYQQIPLLVLTADRPAEWIDQWDGQTIRQDNLYGRHVKGSFTFPDEAGLPDKLWHAKRLVKEALALAKCFPMGPVHINIPVREPFYPEPNENYAFEITDLEPVLEVQAGSQILGTDAERKLRNQLSSFRRILLIPGQQRPNPKIYAVLADIVREQKAILVTDTICNMSQEGSVAYHDFFIGDPARQQEMAPDLVISFGKSILSKALKQFLRKHPAAHWHIQPEGPVSDPYKNLSQIIRLQPETFLPFFLAAANPVDPLFEKRWMQTNEAVRNHLHRFLGESKVFGELQALQQILPKIPAHGKVHLANSLAVRNVNFLGRPLRDVEIISNRGTSGIDGSNSTAVGCTFTTKETVSLITGDMAFFYDRNAFWHQYQLANLRVLLFNNQGGGIFRMIDGPALLPELEEYFETRQKLTAEHLAAELGFDYWCVADLASLQNCLESFYQKSLKPKILEIKTSSESNTRNLKLLKENIRRHLDSTNL
ncbi:2-succinyl-5-enolpyruvyl-6-hydroxy-3-cyclohexene-1-carboxylic-acid synthase [Cyclobacterium xiamenense]|uniref:2-succinyl-5-enolpyruvyl-6-hydroxy-3- cyclohexene-1-carboxylic-acid synthase n=1 Tax=Cyclobacterium xiamenense TaxID=1297121 RepID=UPI0035CFE2BB